MKTFLYTLLVVGLLSPGSIALAGEPSSAMALSLPEQPMRDALNGLARQTGLQVMFATDEVADDLMAPRVEGTLTPAEALARLLANTPLDYKFVNPRIVSVYLKSRAMPTAEKVGAADEVGERGRIHLAQGAEEGVGEGQGGEATGGEREEGVQLEEIVVTGTHIRGATPASRVLTFTRGDIERNGFGNVIDLIQSIPQNFNGGANEGTIGSIAGGGNSGNSTDGTGVNLRGLGNDSSLVLVNGRRVAPGNTDGNFIDISLIPLNAVERVEVLPDGASAIYGSDAVGGVVNFILQKDFKGAETHIRNGVATSGSYQEFQVGQTAGATWDSGSAMISYEYFDQEGLSAADRSFTKTAQLPFSLLPDQTRHGVLATVNEVVRPGFEFFADGTYAHRTSSSDTTQPGFPSSHVPVKVEAYSATLGARINAFRGAQLELSATYGHSDSQVTAFDVGVPDPSSDRQARSQIVSLDTKLDGTFGSTRSGPIRFALGTQFRDEELEQLTLAPLGAPAFRPDRDILAGFVEINIPLLRSNDDASSSPLLDINLADRQEHYSDFGSTNNPQIALNWRPSAGLRLTGTYGTSFVAPQLSKLSPNLEQAAALPISDPEKSGECDPFGSGEKTGCTNVIVLFGGNTGLGPQEATTWTVGMDFHPLTFPGLQTRVTYYDIHYEDRIARLPDLGFSRIFDALVEESVFGTAIVQRDPGAPLVQQFQADPAYLNFTGDPDPVAIGAIVDARYQNLSSVRTSGIDVDIEYKTNVSGTDMEWGFDGTYLLKFKNQFTSSSPEFSILNTIYNPIDLKVRGRALISRGPFNAGLFLNYLDHYRNDTVVPIAPIASWTTADATFSYELGDGHSYLSNASFRLGINNVADKDPPFVSNPTASSIGIFYDGANASALGRFVYGQILKRW